ncbi:MAG: hypothetical protein H0X42_05975 [Solirubrobacterales bacterium]|nr:hypothetical protein [Solirubrobacterales bacterium]
MREKLNGNPMAQIGIVMVLIVAAFVMLTKGGGGSESEGAATPTEATVSIAGTGASATATGATPGEAVESATEGAGEAAVLESSLSATPIPTAPMPPPVAAAYNSNKTVILAIAGSGELGKELVKSSTEIAARLPATAIFVVPMKQIARYGAITLGVHVQRVPALVVMRPRRLSDGTPQASVSYGFQSAQAIEQGIRDASYNGPEATYDPN